MPVYATRNVTIPKGTRLCQFRIQKNQPDILFKEVDSLNDSNRSGWGSTGA
nr:MAG TPA: deoxyuridine 5'-triphosphate nucleotidohydrolase [Bacteriophage sp.]